MSNRYAVILATLFIVIDILIYSLSTGGFAAAAYLTIFLALFSLTVGRFFVEITFLFDTKTNAKLKTFSRLSKGDIFPSGFYSLELSYKAQLCVEAIPRLFALIIFQGENTQNAQAIEVAHQYFKKRFLSSKRYSLFSTDEKFMAEKFGEFLKAHRFSSEYRTPCLDVIKSKLSYEGRFELLEHLFMTAHASGEVIAAEQEMLLNISKFLLINEWDILSLEYKYGCKKEGKSTSNTPYKEIITNRSYKKLGLEASASENEIKAAYRKIVMQYHPDKLTDDCKIEEREEAIMLFRQATEAYEEICAERGIK